MSLKLSVIMTPIEQSDGRVEGYVRLTEELSPGHSKVRGSAAGSDGTVSFSTRP
jgi:hypothetical protein